MKHERRIPAWLLRDLPALAGMFACFWLLVIPLIAEGFHIIRGGKPSQDKFDSLAQQLLNAEATLAYALWREAYRRLGYNPKLVKLELADLPADNIALMARIRSYMDQIQNLSRASAHYTDILRKRWPSFSPVRRASRATSSAPRVQEDSHQRLSTTAHSAWEAACARSARHGGGNRWPAFAAQARAPPNISPCYSTDSTYLNAPARLRTRPRAYRAPAHARIGRTTPALLILINRRADKHASLARQLGEIGHELSQHSRSG